MRFDDPSEDDDAPIRREPIVPSIDRTSRAIRTKLLMLFAMLIMVIVLMKEAGKPERWKWMGFETAKTTDVEIADSTGPIRPGPSGSEPASVSESSEIPGSPIVNSAVTPGNPSRAITISGNSNGLSEGQRFIEPVVNFDQPVVESDYPVAAVAFWNSAFRRLNADQQTVLLQLLKSIRTGQAIRQNQQSASQQLTRHLGNRRDQFQQTLFDQLALTADGSLEKTQLANEMYESQEIWDKKIFPALDAASRGVDFTMGQRQAVLELQQVLDPLLYEQVQDHTSLGWAGDSAAWIRIWEKITDGETPKGKPTTRIELMGQPKLYRGKPVAVEGWVRSARMKTLDPESELGLTHYFILWVRPSESKLGPLCIYAMSLPEGFPPVTESFSDVNEHVRVNGFSFKIRNFMAADSTVNECPVILAPGLERIETAEFTSVSQWQPSRTTLTIAFIMIPLIATGLAWLVFRNSKTHQYLPGKKSQQKINQKLSELADDPHVKTEREKVMSLYESEPHDQ